MAYVTEFTQAGASSGATSVTQAVTGIQTGDTIVVWVSKESAATVSVSDPSNGSYTSRPAISNGAVWTVSPFYLLSAVAGNYTITASWTGSTTFRGMYVQVFSGRGAFDNSAGQRQTTGTTRNSGSFTVAAGADIAAYCQDYNQLATPTTNSPMTSRGASLGYGGTNTVRGGSVDNSAGGSLDMTFGTNTGADSYTSALSFTAAGGGGTVFTETLTDTISITDPVLAWMLRNRLGDSGLLVTDELISSITGSGVINTATLTDAITASDGALVFILRNRALEDTVTVSEPGVQRFWFLNADSEITVTDEVQWYRRIFRLLEDGAELIDLISASVSGAGTVFTGSLTDAITVGDQALTSIERNRLLEDTTVAGDDLQAWALRNRLGEDAISADDDGLRYAIYLRHLEDAVEISDELISSYLPFVDTYVTNPVVLGAMPNPVQLGAGPSAVLH